MKEFLEILKYTLPSIIVFLTAFLTIKSFLNKDKARRKFELMLNNQKFITPIRLQAYERLIIFLERINPDSLIVRVQKPRMSVKQLQVELIKTIRSEYEHNLSQQVYVSNEAWEAVEMAKESIVKLIYVDASKQRAMASVSELSQIIIKIYASTDKSPTATAINLLKNEIFEILE